MSVRANDNEAAGTDISYQLEVKRDLVKMFFLPAAGWDVTIDVDAMELGKGTQYSADKSQRAEAAVAEIERLGAKIGTHDIYGRVDVVARHPEEGLRLIEVEGDSSRQREQALYSCLGQLILTMRVWPPDVRYGVAVPDGRRWRTQLEKIPSEVRERLQLDLYLVGADRGTLIVGREEIPRWGRG